MPWCPKCKKDVQVGAYIEFQAVLEPDFVFGDEIRDEHPKSGLHRIAFYGGEESYCHVCEHRGRLVEFVKPKDNV